MIDRPAGDLRAARRRERREESHPLFWLLLGFLCGVMATLGVLLVSSGHAPADGVTVKIPLPAPLSNMPVAAPPPKPNVIAPPVNVEVPPRIETDRRSVPRPQRAVQADPAERTPDLPARKPPRPAAGRSVADQMAEDAAASGMTARTR